MLEKTSIWSLSICQKAVNMSHPVYPFTSSGICFQPFSSYFEWSQKKKVIKPKSETYVRDWRLGEKVESKKEIVSEKVVGGFGGKTVISLMANHPGAIVKQYHAIGPDSIKS